MSKRNLTVWSLRLLAGVVMLCLGWTACTPQTAAPATMPAAPAAALPGNPRTVENHPPLPSLAPRPTATFVPTVAPSTTAPAAVQVCAPFPGYDQAALLAAISNPFKPPPLGSDDPHQAIDLAITQNDMALAGGPVLAALAGTVAMVNRSSFPYGNALLVETPLRDLPAGLPVDALPTAAPTLPPHPALTCPPAAAPASAERALYLLYAHLADAPAFQVGDAVACGQLIGAIGQTGNALNPHLHLEARLGPAGARFAGLAHYDASAGADEMGSYCLWRVSNLFQLVDPLSLLSVLP